MWSSFSPLPTTSNPLPQDERNGWHGLSWPHHTQSNYRVSWVRLVERSISWVGGGATLRQQWRSWLLWGRRLHGEAGTAFRDMCSATSQRSRSPVLRGEAANKRQKHPVTFHHLAGMQNTWAVQCYLCCTPCVCLSVCLPSRVCFQCLSRLDLGSCCVLCLARGGVLISILHWSYLYADEFSYFE